MEAAESDLWHKYRNDRASPARAQLLLRHLPWARMIARDVFLRVRIRGADWADYVQNASLGLCEAVDRFDVDRGLEFRTYARHRVRGAVFNGLRHLIDPPPTMDSVSAREVAYGERAQSFGEDASDDPLSDVIGAAVGLGLGFLLDIESIPAPAGESNVYAEIERAEMADVLSQLLEQLPERERLIITLHYLQQVPFTHIAEQLGVTKGRVSQIHRRAMERLRGALLQHGEIEVKASNWI